MDETTLQVLKEEGRLATAKSYMVVQARGDPEGQAMVLFHYSPSRSTKAMAPFLEGFRGILLTDGLEVYNSYCQSADGTILAGCWSHARRKFAEAFKATKASNRKGTLAGHGLHAIDQLFKVEASLKNLSPEDRHKERQERSKPITKDLKDWVASNIASVPAKSLIGKAIAYLMNQWGKLTVFLEDGRIPLHNNFVENAICPYAVGRKNWLFSDSEDKAEANAILYSLISTAKLNGLSPLQYLTCALIHVSSGFPIHECLPLAQSKDSANPA